MLSSLINNFVYTIIVAIIVLVIATSKLTNFFGIGHHPFISSIIGIGFGFAVMFIFPTSSATWIATCITTVVTTGLSNFVLSRIW